MADERLKMRAEQELAAPLEKGDVHFVVPAEGKPNIFLATGANTAVKMTGNDEWYNIHNEIGRTMGEVTYVYTHIENYDPILLNNPDNYRFVLMRFKRVHQQGARGWRAPMFWFESLLKSGWTLNDVLSSFPDRTMAFGYQETWWPVEGKVSPWFGGDEIEAHLVLNKTYKAYNDRDSILDPYYRYPTSRKFNATRARLMKVGVAIFKKTGDADKPWKRCSNIAYLQFDASYGGYQCTNGIE